jgi:hypothetical protein
MTGHSYPSENCPDLATFLCSFDEVCQASDVAAVPYSERGCFIVLVVALVLNPSDGWIILPLRDVKSYG